MAKSELIKEGGELVQCPPQATLAKNDKKLARLQLFHKIWPKIAKNPVIKREEKLAQERHVFVKTD